MTDLEGQRLISFSANSPHGRAIAEMCERSKATLSVSTLVRFAETACAFVARGLGVSVVDEQTARDSGFSGIVQVPLRQAIHLPIVLHRSRTSPRSKVSSTFERLCSELGARTLMQRYSSPRRGR